MSDDAQKRREDDIHAAYIEGYRDGFKAGIDLDPDEPDAEDMWETSNARKTAELAS